MTDFIAQVRAQNPVVLTVANMVTPGDVANAVSAIGGSPIMSSSAAEADQMVEIAHGVTINVGTLRQEQQKQIEAVMAAADPTDKPVVLDPVAVAMPYRGHFVNRLLSQHRVTLIRGNAGEIAALAGIPWGSRGVDSGKGNPSELKMVATTCAQKYHCLVALTGQRDVITDGDNTVVNDCGTTLFQTYVGCGDMISSVLAAFLAANGSTVAATAAGVQAFTAAGWLAATDLDHPAPGSFFVHLLDELYDLDDSRMITVIKKQSKEEFK